MRQLVCQSCLNDYLPKWKQRRPVTGPPTKHRLVRGTAKLPMAAHRVMFINGEPEPLDSAHYDCDLCGGSIEPGQLCGAFSAWPADRGEMVEWETEYLEPLSQEEYDRIIGVGRRLEGQ